MNKLQLTDADQYCVTTSGIFGDYEFGLKLRVHCPASLWNAAAARCLRDHAVPEGDLADLIGPEEDPSVDDCLMILTLPDAIPGCTLLDTALNAVERDPVASDLHALDDLRLCSCAA